MDSISQLLETAICDQVSLQGRDMSMNPIFAVFANGSSPAIASVVLVLLVIFLCES